MKLTRYVSEICYKDVEQLKSNQTNLSANHSWIRIRAITLRSKKIAVCRKTVKLVLFASFYFYLLLIDATFCCGCCWHIINVNNRFKSTDHFSSHRNVKDHVELLVLLLVFQFPEPMSHRILSVQG